MSDGVSLNTGNYTWLPADYSAFEFRNCSAVTLFRKDLVQSSDVPLVGAADIITDALEPYWQSEGIAAPGYGDILHWLGSDAESENSVVVPQLIQDVDAYVYSDCLEQYCKLLPWQGNSDLSGRGMLVSYYLQAGLTTFYMIVLGLGRFNKSARLFKKDTLFERTLVAVQESTKTFLDSAAFFCIVMFVATLYVYALGVKASPQITMTSYVHDSSALISLWTIFPTLLLHSCASNHLRREKMRMYVWGLIGVLTTIIMVLFWYIPSGALVGTAVKIMQNFPDLFSEKEKAEIMKSMDGLVDPELQLHWEINCVDGVTVIEFANWPLRTWYALMASTAFYLLFVENIFRIPFLSHKKYPILKRFRKNWWWVSGFLSFAAMWAVLAIFIVYRDKFNEMSGTSNKDHEWGFGQVLAIATWVPVIIELGLILKSGAVDALNGQLSDKYQVVPVPGMSRNNTDDINMALNQIDENLSYEPRRMEESTSYEPVTHYPK